MQQKKCLNSEYGLHLTSDPWIFLWHYPDLMVGSLDILVLSLPTPTAQLAIGLPWTYLLVVFCLIIPNQSKHHQKHHQGCVVLYHLDFLGQSDHLCSSEISSGLMYLLRIERTSLHQIPNLASGGLASEKSFSFQP